MNEDEQKQYDALQKMYDDTYSAWKMVSDKNVQVIAELATVKDQRDTYKARIAVQDRQLKEMWVRITTMKDRRGTPMAGSSDLEPLPPEVSPPEAA